MSLAPSITHVVLELGLGESLVGAGDGDALAPLGTPQVGRYLSVDLEKLLVLAPTHVLAQTGEAKLPRRVSDLARSGRFALADLEYPADPDAAVALIRAIGRELGRDQAADRLADGVAARLGDIAALTAPRPAPRALLVFSTDPLRVSGPGSVNDRLLRIAGGENAASAYRVSAPVLDREALRASAPEVVFLMEPGGAPWAGPDDPRRGPFEGLALPALRDGRVVVLNDPAVLLPGPSMAATAASMAEALHPDLDVAIAEVFRDRP